MDSMYPRSHISVVGTEQTVTTQHLITINDVGTDPQKYSSTRSYVDAVRGTYDAGVEDINQL